MQEMTLLTQENRTSNIHSSDFGSVSYDIFGSPYQKLGSFLADDSLDFGYLGKPYNADTELYDYGFRDYSPATARFTTVDPIRDGRNWFCYVVNDPVNYVDLWGLQCKSESDKIDAYYDWHSLNNQLNTYLKLSWELEDKIIKTEFEIEELEYKKKDLENQAFIENIIETLEFLSIFEEPATFFIEGLRQTSDLRYALGIAVLNIDVQAVSELIADNLNDEAYNVEKELKNLEETLIQKESENKSNKILLNAYREEISKIKEEMNGK